MSFNSHGGPRMENGIAEINRDIIEESMLTWNQLPATSA